MMRRTHYGSQSEYSVEDLCRKLRPILGDKINQIYKSYTLTDDLERRKEIEQTLNALFHKHIQKSMLDENILLEPPKEDQVKGNYPLGAVSYADKELYPFALRDQDWPRHVCVSGMSGSGKTNFAYQIIGNFILQKKPFIVFDWKKSFRPLTLMDKDIMVFTVGKEDISNFFKININEPPRGVGAKEWVSILCDLINESFFASYGVHKILSETLDDTFKDFGIYKGSKNYPTWYQVKDRLDDKQEELKKGRESEWAMSAVRIAHSLTFGNFGPVINNKEQGGLKVEDILNKNVIFELHCLNNAEKKFFCEFLLTYIYKLKKSNQEENTEDFKSAIVVDEAHNIFLKDRPTFIKETVTDMVYREIREYGISLVCLDQHISKLSETVVGNSACNIGFQQVLPPDVDTISHVMQLREERQYFAMLPVGIAIVRLAERYHKPFLIKVPLVKIKKKMVTDQEIRESTKKKVMEIKKINLFKTGCDEEQIKKKLKRLNLIMNGASTEVITDNDEHERELEQMIKKKVKAKKKTARITNHMQTFLIDYINAKKKKGMTVPDIRKQLKDEGYKISDINAALKRVNYSLKSYEITHDHTKFLRALEDQEGLPTSSVYKILGLSARRGNSVKEDLKDLGLIEVETVKTDKGWMKIIKLAS